MPAMSRRTGSIKIDGCRDRIKPKMTVEEFLASRLGADARSEPSRGRRRWFHLGPLTIGGAPFMLGAMFLDGIIDHVTLICSNDRYGRTWEDFSEKKERARKAFHDRWLRTHLGPSPLATPHPWGKVQSIHDQAHGGGSSILIRYAR